jgi:hypothetical protein
MSNTITPTVFYRTLNVEGLEIFYRDGKTGDGVGCALTNRLQVRCSPNARSGRDQRPLSVQQNVDLFSASDS